ncbi:MAG: hypothetical protein EOM87_07695, partial [Clostridia bacterium]|nr:hypothetical protein [Clostridia bacterium]
SSWDIPNETNLKAKWELKTYTISYTDTYDAENTNPTSFTFETETFSLTALADTNGLRFVKWVSDDNDITEISGTIGKDITIKATWNYIQYDLVFHLGEGQYNEGESNPAEYNKSQSITFVNPVSNKQGYAFDGWYDAVTNGNKHTGISIGTIDDKTYYARYKIIEYGIAYQDTYNTTNTNPTSYTIETETITLNSLSGRNGYTFIEWQDIEGEKVTSIPKGSSGEITLKAVWEIIDYTITYNNTFDLDNTNASGYNVETSTITLSNLSGRTGYTFNGWYTAPTDGTKKTDIEKGSYGNLQLYARWTTNRYTVSLDRESSVNSFTISFDGNGYDLNIPTQTLTDESSLYYPDVPTRSGYIFSGWYENSEGTGNSFDFTAEIKTDIVLYAKWVSSSSPIYVGESKSIYISGQTYNNYEFIPLVSGNITIYTTGSVDTYGYLLQGNNQLTYNDDGGSNTNFRITYNVTAGVKYTIKVRGYGSGSSGNSVLYLIGVSKPTAGGTVTSGSNAVTVSYGTNYSLGVPESIKGYAFDGWYTEIDCGGTKLTDATGASLNIWSIDGDIVVYSGYQRLTYNVEFVANGGSTVGATNLYYGDRLDLNEYITTRSGYSFIGWYLDISDSEAYEATTMPDHNLSLTAKWIVYNLNDFKYNIEKLAISEFDTINAALFNAELFDSDGELVEIEATLNGTQEAGQTVSIRLLASGKYDKKKQVTINNIKVYGMPSISYDTEKDYFNLSDTLNSALFGL